MNREHKDVQLLLAGVGMEDSRVRDSCLAS